MVKKDANNVLITGGTGLIGSHLTELLISKHYNVAHLSRSSSNPEKIKTYKWDVEKDYVEPGAIQWADYIIHLAGANIAEKRWTEKRKKVIKDSRVKSAQLIIDKLKTEQNSVKALISASGVGYYGDTGDQWTDENAPPATDFFGKTSVAWERTVKKAKEMEIRVCIFRAGIVLSKDGGALPQLEKPVKYFAGAPLGSGDQYIPWIHMEDICTLYLKAIEDSNMSGEYNAVAPNPVTNKDFTKAIARVLKKPLFLPHVPAFVLKIILGEMSDVVLISSRISNKKLLNAGFKFKYNNLEEALLAIYNNN